MKLPSLIGVASLSVLCLGAVRADPAAPVDLTRRNSVFAPANPVLAAKISPTIDAAVQDRRIDQPVVSKPASVVGTKRAPIAVEETSEKRVLDQMASQPKSDAREMSRFNHRLAPVATGSAVATTRTVSRYQDSMKAASAANMARFPALDRSTVTKLNRFVVRPGAPNAAPVTGAATIVPAGGGSAVLK